MKRVSVVSKVGPREYWIRGPGGLMDLEVSEDVQALIDLYRAGRGGVPSELEVEVADDGTYTCVGISQRVEAPYIRS